MTRPYRNVLERVAMRLYAPPVGGIPPIGMGEGQTMGVAE
jgi:hypothetical protein